MYAIDSRGNKSTTLFFIYLGAAAMLFKYLIGGHYGFSNVDTSAFGIAYAALLAAYTYREHGEKNRAAIRE